MKRKISVIGLGYVGLQVAVEFGKFEKIIGFDIDETRLKQLRKGSDVNGQISEEDLRSSKIRYTSKDKDLLILILFKYL